MDYDTKRSKQMNVRVLSILDLDAQMTSDGATWIDRNLVAPTSFPRDSGFGHEVQQAQIRRQQWLVEQGLANLDNATVTFKPNMIAILERRELLRVGRQMASQRNDQLPFQLTEKGDNVSGVFRQTMELASGKYAMIENSREFTLVPWRPVLENQLGKHISGWVRGNGISWEIGRSRGLDIGM